MGTFKSVLRDYSCIAMKKKKLGSGINLKECRPVCTVFGNGILNDGKMVLIAVWPRIRSKNQFTVKSASFWL